MVWPYNSCFCIEFFLCGQQRTLTLIVKHETTCHYKFKLVLNGTWYPNRPNHPLRRPQNKYTSKLWCCTQNVYMLLIPVITPWKYIHWQTRFADFTAGFALPFITNSVLTLNLMPVFEDSWGCSQVWFWYGGYWWEDWVDSFLLHEDCGECQLNRLRAFLTNSLVFMPDQDSLVAVSSCKVWHIISLFALTIIPQNWYIFNQHKHLLSSWEVFQQKRCFCGQPCANIQITGICNESLKCFSTHLYIAKPKTLWYVFSNICSNQFLCRWPLKTAGGSCTSRWTLCPDSALTSVWESWSTPNQFWLLRRAWRN